VGGVSLGLQIPSRIRQSLRGALSGMAQIWTRYNESVLGIQTEPRAIDVYVPDPTKPWKGLSSAKATNQDNFRYGTIGYWHIRKILYVLDPGPDDIFYDIGAGMGRVLCVAAQRPIRKCVGIELLEPLCAAAQKNAERMRGKRAPIQIRCADASTADLSDGTIYFMFNPFGPKTLHDTFENIRQSLDRNPRAVKIAYYHSKHKTAVDGLDWLVKVHDFPSFGGHPVTIWENRRSWMSKAS
jgi:predicted RNA methylase